MADFLEAGIKLVADTGDAYDSIEALGALADDVTSGSYLLTLETEVDTSGLDTAELPTDGETINQTVEIEESPTSVETLDALNVLKNAKILETTWNIVGTGVELIQRFGGDLLQPMLDLDTAVANVNSQTGKAIPNARELIHDIFYDDLGESIGQVGQLITQAHNIGAPVDEATRAALRFTHTFQDQNPETVLNALNQLVVNKLTPDFKTGGDILVTAFQNGADRGKDLLQALNDNATAIHNMGLTGPEALSFIKTGLDNGFNSATQVLNLLEKIKQNVTNAAGNPTSDVSKTLRQLGIANPAETGEAWSADFFKAVIDKIANAPGLTDTQKETLFSNLAGGKQGGKTFAAFLQMSPEEADTIFANVGGAAERAAQEADDSLSGALADFQLAVSEKVQDVLSSSAIDIPGKIQKLKEGLQNALDELAAGGTLSDALTVALKPLGLDNAFQQLESTLGNMVISLLQVAQSIQDFTGHGEQAAGTGQVISRLSRQQLDFDLKISNAEELQSVIATAASRGLSSKDIEGEISGVIQGLVKAGTKESLDQAQAIINTLKTPVDQNKLPTLASGAPMNVEPVVSDSALDNLQGQIDQAMAKVPPPEKVDAWQQSLDAFGESTQTVTTTATDATSAVNKAAKSTDDLAKNAGKVYPQTDQTADSLANVTVQADTASIALDGVAASLQITLDKANSVSQAADHLAQQQATQDASGQANPDQKAGMSLMAAVLGYIAGSSSYNRSVSNVINNNNTIPNIATADALGYQQSSTLRGFG